MLWKTMILISNNKIQAFKRQLGFGETYVTGWLTAFQYFQSLLMKAV